MSRSTLPEHCGLLGFVQAIKLKMRGLCKPLIPLNAAKVRKKAHAAKYFSLFCIRTVYFVRQYSVFIVHRLMD
jgi:hypothetical protein